MGLADEFGVRASASSWLSLMPPPAQGRWWAKRSGDGAFWLSIVASAGTGPVVGSNFGNAIWLPIMLPPAQAGGEFGSRDASLVAGSSPGLPRCLCLHRPCAGRAAIDSQTLVVVSPLSSPRALCPWDDD